MVLSQQSISVFWSKVDIKSSDDCWDWLAGLFRSGYGSYTADNKTYRAHRISWELTNGPIPEDRLILHKCDNKRCCNPNHLYCGTHTDNQHDRNERNPTSANMAGRGKTKLSEKEIYLIRKTYKEKRGTTPQMDIRRELASQFKVSVSTISRVAASSVYLCKEGNYI